MNFIVSLCLHAIDIQHVLEIFNYAMKVKVNKTSLFVMLSFKQKGSLVSGRLMECICMYNKNSYVSRMMATNYMGAFSLTKLLLPLLRSSPVPSRIVNVSSFTHLNGEHRLM